MTARIIRDELLVFLLLLLAGCTSTHDGELGWVDRAPTVDDPVETVRTVDGTAKGTFILGLFGPKDMHLYDRARRELVDRADLEENQHLVSRSLDVTTAKFPPELDLGFVLNPIKIVPIYYQKTVHVSAEVVHPIEKDQS